MIKKCRAERSIGFYSVSIVKESYYITDDFDWVLSRLVFQNRLLTLILSYISFVAICIVSEQVHCYVDGGLLPSRLRRSFSRVELFFYRFLEVRLFVWTYGADVRTQDKTLSLGLPNCCFGCVEVGSACVCDADNQRRNFQIVSSTAKAVFSMGDMIEYTPGSRNDLFFWPIDLRMEGGRRYAPTFPSNLKTQPLRVVHAPNHRHFKGTSFLQEAISELRSEGIEIELVLVEGMSNESAIEVYRSADLIFDQCLIGFHGYFALEAMALGKPVMCFIRDPDKYLLHAEECPIINTHINSLRDDLRSIAKRREELNSIGKQGRQYVETHYSLEAFAGRLSRFYKDLGII